MHTTHGIPTEFLREDSRPQFLLCSEDLTGRGRYGPRGDGLVETTRLYSLAELEERILAITPADLAETRVHWREYDGDRWVEVSVLIETGHHIGMRWTCPRGDGIHSWHSNRPGWVLTTLYRYHRHEDQQQAPDTTPAGLVCALTYGKSLGPVERQALADFQAQLAEQRRAETGETEA